MNGPAVRSRLLTLRQERRAARLGWELLDNKREAILRELLQRARRRDELRLALRGPLRDARRKLQEARIEIGGAQIDGAVLAQPISVSVDVRHGSIVGVPNPRLQPRTTEFVPQYGVGGTTASLDATGARFSALLPTLIGLAQEEEAARNLQAGLLKTVRRLKALEQVVIPRLERDVRDVAAALEEDERDESVRRKGWLAIRAGRLEDQIRAWEPGARAARDSIPGPGASRGSAPNQ
jgi:V/A-type H+-transporting ATPase subunit D